MKAFAGICLSLFFFVSPANSADLFSGSTYNGFIEIYEGRELYIEYKAPAEGHPTVVLLNGMTYSTKDWSRFVAQFKERNPNAGVLAYDMYGQGKTLIKYANEMFFASLNPDRGRIAYTDQANDLRLLLKKLAPNGPIHLAGLSYGGGIAQQFLNDFQGSLEEKLESIILMAPFMEPLKNQVEWIEKQIYWTRVYQPWNAWSDEALYDFYLRVLVYSTYPAAEPVILETPYKLEATYRLAQGMKDFDGFKYLDNFPARKVHMMVPTEDEYISQEGFKVYWDEMPEEARASLLFVEGGRHKLPEELPGLTVEWISRLIYDEQGNYKKGLTYHSNRMGLPKVKSSKCEFTLEMEPFE